MTDAFSDMAKSAVRSIAMEHVMRNTDHHPHHGGAGGGSTARNTGSSNGMDHSMHGMSPYLFANLKPFFVLFNEARVTTGGGLVIAIVASFLFTVLATIFSSYSKKLEGLAARDPKRVSGGSLLATLTFSMRMLLHYVAMLLVMTMNVWLILAVVAGHGVGFLTYASLFRKRDAEKPIPVDGEPCDC